MRKLSDKRCRSNRVFEDREGNTLSMQQLYTIWQKSQTEQSFEEWFNVVVWQEEKFLEITPHTHINHTKALPRAKQEKRQMLLRDFKLKLTEAELAEIENCTSDFALDAVCKSILIRCYEQNRFSEKEEE